ncbi:MAG TPA: glycoside hydrolase family 88 protein [Candidatus Tetragenococcus pullicola]|nr:glycoside hydrolase family 88 protein [Candidatus Tetragenococcus pullicola]
MKVKAEKQTIEPLLDAIVEKTMQMDLTWDWSTGVAYYGICRAYKETGNPAYLESLRARIDEWIELGVPETITVNRCAMGHCLLTLYQETNDENYWQLIEKQIHYLQEDAPRFGKGVLQHTVSAADDFPEQAWADTLFMAAFFMLRVGVFTENESLINDALNQYYWHIHYLQDRKSGLFYHGYAHLTEDHLSGFYWARANAWAAYTMAEVGAHLPQAYLYPPFMDVQGSLSEQLAALKFLQTDRGLWHTILDDPDSYEEISASCGIAAAMVVNNNPLHQKYVQKALTGILDNITNDGRVLNVSAGTAIMRDRQGYREISKDWLQGWGQGLALTFLSEILATNQ